VSDVEAWLRAVVETPGLTALDLAAARSMLAEDALRAIPVVARYDGPIVDVGSGNGSPGIPIALELPAREVVLLEAEAKRCAFLERWAPANARVLKGRAEEQETDWAGVALAKALAPPPVAVEWCLPLVRPGGAAVLWIGENADLAALGRVASRLAAVPVTSPPGLAVLEKRGPTPAGFPRRAGIARKRPLG
jgi:16S rRNA (guanine527-N7)-methyltransferase